MYIAHSILRYALLSAILCMTGCASLASSEPDVKLPDTYEAQNLRITLTGMAIKENYYDGVYGIATNIGPVRLGPCDINLEVLDASGSKVGDADVYTNGLDPGQTWKFMASFSMSTYAYPKEVRAGRVTTYAAQ